MKKYKSKITFNFAVLVSSLFLLIFNLSILFSQEGSWNFGDHKMLIDQSSNPLRVNVRGNASLSSYSVVGSVGGVAFQEVAINYYNYKNLAATYNANNEDGFRLEITIDGNKYTPFIPDWQLIPIIKYSDSQYNSCVSLFGENTTESTYNIIYHEAFENTLLGVRLLHADILLMDMESFRELPKFNGKVILGTGEEMPDNNSWMQAAMSLQEILQKYTYQSWIITDVYEKVTIKTTLNEVQFAGMPYHHFWRADFEAYETEFNRLIERANDAKRNGDISRHNSYVDQANNLEPDVYAVSPLIKKIKEKSLLLEMVNPIVYNVMVNTMKFSAFFRYLKENSSQNWNQLLHDTKYVSISPKVKTPTTWKR